MCNEKPATYSRAELAKAFNLPSTEMTNGEAARLSRELAGRRAGEATKGSRLKQDSGGLGLVGR